MGKVTLKYTAKIYSNYFKGSPVFSIEIFNDITSQWFTFIEDIIMREEVFTKQRTISDKDASESENMQFLLDRIEKNSYPNTRIRLIDNKQIESKNEIAKIVANNYASKVTRESVVFDFGENWLLKEEDYHDSKQMILVASQYNAYLLYEKLDKADALNLKLKGDNTKAAAKIKEVEDSLESSKNEFKLEKENYQATIQEGKDKAVGDQAIITGLKSEKTTLSSDLVKKTADYADLNQRFEDYKENNESTHPNKIAAKNVYQNFVRDVSSADEALQNSNYKLSNISLDIKATVENGGDGVVLGLIDFDSLTSINGEGISTIKLDIERDTTPQEISYTVPNVIDMTLSKVKSIVMNSGYLLESIYQNPNSSNVTGLSVKQFPAAGSELAQGETISVIFQ